MESKKRERSANFIATEVQLLAILVDQYKLTIENKKTDAVTNRKKEAVWKKIEHAFNSCGISTYVRSWKTLKLKYEGLKKITKKKSSLQSDTISIPIPAEEVHFDTMQTICSNTQASEDEIENSVEDKIIIPDLEESYMDTVEEPDSQNENKWEKSQLKAFKSSSLSSKAGATPKWDKLSEARLQLVQLQIENTKKQQQFMDEEQKLKMLHLINAEKRKEELHALITEKIRCGAVPIGMI